MRLINTDRFQRMTATTTKCIMGRRFLSSDFVVVDIKQISISGALKHKVQKSGIIYNETCFYMWSGEVIVWHCPATLYVLGWGGGQGGGGCVMCPARACLSVLPLLLVRYPDDNQKTKNRKTNKTKRKKTKTKQQQ